MLVLYQMNCIRKHLIKNKTYQLQVMDQQMILCEHNKLPKYTIQFDFKSCIMWKKTDDNNKLISFGIMYNKRIKWFNGDSDQLNLLQMHLSNRIYQGNISLFYDSIDIIGSGASSKVCLVRRKCDVLQFAAKCISKKYINGKKSQDRITRLQSEISILRQIEHPIFLKLHECFEGDNSYYLITDYYEGGTLYHFIRNYPFDIIPSDTIRIAIQTILQGLCYLQEVGLIHRDIKLENILLGKLNDIQSLKIIDFGLAIYEKQNIKLCVCGTPGYIAPEILNYDKTSKIEQYFTTKCDIFSAGVIFYKLLTKRTLFRASNTDEIMNVNKQCQIQFNEFEQKIQKEALHLLKLMLEPNPNNRPNAIQCLQHPYFTCQLEKNQFFSDFSLHGEQQIETESVPDESQAAQIKCCQPTQYRIRIQQKKRTRSPRKYADFQFYVPSFCQMNSFESEGYSSKSSQNSKIENIINQKDSVIEENKVS